MRGPQGNAIRVFEVATTMNLDMVARTIRAVCGWWTPGQYRIQIGDQTYGDPPGRSAPSVKKGKGIGLTKALKGEAAFEFRRAGTRRQRVSVELTGIVEPEEPFETYPRLVELKGVSPRDFEPEPRSSEWWEDAIDNPDHPGYGHENPWEPLAKSREELDTVTVRMSLEAIANRRRGPLRSHGSESSAVS